MNTFSIQELVNQTIRENGKREKKEIKSWHPSKLGSCLTGVYLERAGAEPDEPLDDRTLRVFSVGTMLEDWLVKALEKQYPHIERQARVEWPEMNVSGYADLVVDFGNGKKIVYEIKSRHSRAFWHMTKEGKPSRHHEYQAWIYCKVLNIEESRLIYLSKDDLAIQEYSVFLNDKRLEQEVADEINLLNRAWKENLPPPIPFDNNDWRAQYCNFHKKCVAQPQYLSI